MAVSPLALKIGLGTLGVAGTSVTGYLVWDNFLNSGLTKWDEFLLSEKSKTEFEKLTWQDESNDTNSTTTTAVDNAPQLKLTFTTEAEQSKKTGIKLEISNKTTGKEILENSGINTWSCSITKQEGDKNDLHIDTTTKTDSITKLKESLGIGSTGKKVVWESLKTFIKRCAYEDRKANIGNNKSLSRTIKLKTENIGGDKAKWQLSGLNKFFS